jgi:hypothetical protein
MSQPTRVAAHGFCYNELIEIAEEAGIGPFCQQVPWPFLKMAGIENREAFDA